MFNQRLVHLDLKGAAPKIEYLIKLLPILKKLGCTGLLIEYEDTFPYTGLLSILKNKHHYSEEELRRLLESCIVNKLTVVPLIQCLGHAEFILKHYRFSNLREHSSFPNVLCPSNEKTIQLICNMIEQIVSLHSKYIDLNYIHLGCDEVYFLANCHHCLSKLNENQWIKECLFLNHVSKLADIVQANYSLKPIIWDDMLRSPTITMQLIDKFELNKRSLNLMVWHYCNLTNFQLADEQLWNKYLKSFDQIWIASAFKGASNVDAVFPPIEFHISNHEAWLYNQKQFIVNNSNYRQNLVGIALTGWSRFDHLMCLCELLPTAIPSLALCLQTIEKNGFNEEAHRTASEILGFSTIIPLGLYNQAFYADYPGSQLFCLTLKLLECRTDFKMLYKHPSLVGGFTDFHSGQCRINPLHIQSFLPNAKL